MTTSYLSDWDSRTRRLIGDEAAERLASMRVLVVGVGGVGGYAAEILARSGVGHLTLLDADTVAPSNLNRQIIATIPNIGKEKTELFAERFRNINPDIEVDCKSIFLTEKNVDEILDEKDYDYVVDAIDTVAPKVALIATCMKRRIKIISSMGAGGRIDPSRVEYADLWATREDGLARAVRQRLNRLGLRRPLQVVYSTEPPRSYSVIRLNEKNKRSSYGTLAAIPAIFGIFIAQKIIISAK